MIRHDIVGVRKEKVILIVTGPFPFDTISFDARKSGCYHGIGIDRQPAVCHNIHFRAQITRLATSRVRFQVPVMPTVNLASEVDKDSPERDLLTRHLWSALALGFWAGFLRSRP